MKAKKHLDVRIPLWWPTLRWPSLPGNLRAWLPSRGNVLFVVIVLGALMWAQSVGAFPSAAPTAPTTSTGTIAYQGRLADAGGAPLTGTYTMIFRIYNASTGSVPLWTEQWTGSNSVQVSDGLFNVMLGSMTSISQTMITGNNNLWLGITVGSDDEMLPRVQLGSVPFAVQALTVPDNSITTTKIADAAVTSAKLKPILNWVASKTVTVLTTTPVSVISTTITIDVPSRILVFASCDCWTENGAYVLGYLYMDNVPLGPGAEIHSGSWPTGSTTASIRESVANSIVTDIEPGTHLLDLRFGLFDNVGTGMSLHHSSFSYLVTAR